MRRILDFFRLVIVSPELVMALLPIAVYVYSPGWADILLKPMGEGVGWGLSAAGLCLGMLAFIHKEGFELLSLAGGKKVLIEWPDYSQLKMRILVSFVWCLLGAFACVGATWMVAKNSHPLLGITFMISGLLSAAAATATITLARFSLRELFGE